MRAKPLLIITGLFLFLIVLAFIASREYAFTQMLSGPTRVPSITMNQKTTGPARPPDMGSLSFPATKNATEPTYLTLSELHAKGLEASPLSKANHEFFYVYRPYSDAGFTLARLDPSSKRYIPLDVNRYVDVNTSDMLAISPDGTRFLSPLKVGAEGDKQSLYLVDLQTDSAKVIKRLPAGETFVTYIENFAAYPVSEKSWVNNSEVKVTIYDANKEISGSDGNVHPVLRTETIKI